MKIHYKLKLEGTVEITDQDEIQDYKEDWPDEESMYSAMVQDDLRIFTDKFQIIKVEE